MQGFKNILVLVHGESPSSAAMGHVAELARRGGASLELVSVIEPFPWYTRVLLPASVELQGVLTRDKTDRLESLAAPLRKDGLAITSKVLCGRPALELIREVLRSGHDLVVKVAEPDQGVPFGSTDMRLLRNCPCPVLLWNPEKQGRPFRRILVAVDPPPAPDAPEDLLHLREEVRPEEQALNVKLLELASGLAQSEGAELHVVHAWSAPGEDLLRVEGRRPRQEVDEYVANLHEEARKAVGRLLARSPDESPRRHVHLIKGHAPDVISEFAKAQDIDLIVMGTIVRTGIPGLLFGNTAETVFHRVECSVLAAKPDSFVSPVRLDEEPDNP